MVNFLRIQQQMCHQKLHIKFKSFRKHPPWSFKELKAISLQIFASMQKLEHYRMFLRINETFLSLSEQKEFEKRFAKATTLAEEQALNNEIKALRQTRLKSVNQAALEAFLAPFNQKTHGNSGEPNYG